MPRRRRYLLLQTRNSDDAMRVQEVQCFARALGCDAADVDVVDLLARAPRATEMSQAVVVLLGGSGHYSAAGEGAWLERSLDVLRELHAQSKPTFASCWGFQAMSRAMGGSCIHDPEFAELGTIDLHLSEAGRSDPVFGHLPRVFSAHAGHQDYVVELPPDAVLLASSELVPNQAFQFAGKPIYCTQFHPELDCNAMFERVVAYPEYVERISGMTLGTFKASCRTTPEANLLMRRFVNLVCSD